VLYIDVISEIAARSSLLKAFLVGVALTETVFCLIITTVSPAPL
jgi:hypothetical protein